MSSLGSGISISAELRLKREALQADIEAAKAIIRTGLTSMEGVNLPIAFDPAMIAAAANTAIQSAQASIQPLNIPVNFVGGAMPGMPAGGDINNIVNTSSSITNITNMGGAGSGGGGMGGFGMMGKFMLMRAAIKGAEGIAELATDRGLNSDGFVGMSQSQLFATEKDAITRASGSKWLGIGGSAMNWVGSKLSSERGRYGHFTTEGQQEEYLEGQENTERYITEDGKRRAALRKSREQSEDLRGEDSLRGLTGNARTLAISENALRKANREADKVEAGPSLLGLDGPAATALAEQMRRTAGLKDMDVHTELQSKINFEHQQAGLEHDSLLAESRGDKRGAADKQFDEQTGAARQKLLIEGGDLQQFDDNRKLQRQIMDQKFDRQDTFSSDEADIRDRSIQAHARESRMRANGDDYGARRDEFESTSQREIDGLKAKANELGECAEKTRLLGTAEEMRKATASELVDMDKQHAQVLARTNLALTASAKAENLRAEGHGAAADDVTFQHGIDAEWQDALATGDKAHIAKVKEDVIARQLERRHDKEMQRQSLQLDEVRANASATGNGRYGDYESIREHIVQQEAEYAGPGNEKMLDQVRKTGAAELRAFMGSGIHSISTARGGQGLSDLFERTQSGSSIDINKLIQADVNNLSGGGNITSNLPVAASELRAAAEQIKKSFAQNNVQVLKY